jgi:hypothetical protein
MFGESLWSNIRPAVRFLAKTFDQTSDCRSGVCSEPSVQHPTAGQMFGQSLSSNIRPPVRCLPIALGQTSDRRSDVWQKPLVKHATAGQVFAHSLWSNIRSPVMQRFGQSFWSNIRPAVRYLPIAFGQTSDRWSDVWPKPLVKHPTACQVFAHSLRSN